ncbi:MAG: 30S ribosomal protein S1, partial [Gammaproteobacteria bacterium]|nr:30S ribosomal protein S1 [Gammaproteobacteria bacterium]
TAAHEGNETIIGVITGKVKGGFTVELDNLRAFLPGSLVDLRPVRDISHLENKPIEFKLVKIDQQRNNIVVSRRAIIEAEGMAERESLLENLEEGQEIKGIIKNLTGYGAFVDLGGIDGLLHITDICWKRIKHPEEVLTVGDEITVKVLKFDQEKNRVSLGIKQLSDDPWQDLLRRYPQGSRLFGKVTTITDYGRFVEIDNGIEGLVHISEMDWTNKNINPNKIVSIGDEVEVLILEIDQVRRRISLGLKHCTENPWEVFSENHAKGDKITGTIKSITDFGIFLGLEGNIDGLVHVSDIAWSKSGEELIREYKKDQEIETVILAIDPDRERISLGIKQLDDDPFAAFAKGTIVSGEVTDIEEEHFKIDLGEGIIGHLKKSEIDRDTVLQQGDNVEARVLLIDRKHCVLQLSTKNQDAYEEKQALKEFRKSNQSTSGATLGDLFKEKIDE